MNLGHLDHSHIDLRHPDEIVGDGEIAGASVRRFDERENSVIGDREVIRYLRERTLDDIATALAEVLAGDLADLPADEFKVGVRILKE